MQNVLGIALVLVTLISCKKDKIENLSVYRECDETYLLSNDNGNVYLICNGEELDGYANGTVVDVKVKETKYDCKYAQKGCSVQYYTISQAVTILKFK